MHCIRTKSSCQMSLCCCREEKGKSIMQPQHTAVMVEPDEAASSSSAGTLHSRSYRPTSGTPLPMIACAL